jgi:hypothetical protein
MVFLWAAVLAAVPAHALPPESAESPVGLESFDYDTQVDTNDLLMYLSNRGWVGYDPGTGGPGLYYPAGESKSVVYAAGLWMATRMGKGYRASVAEYDADFSPGSVIGGVYQPDNEAFRVYKIRRGDSFGFNPDYDEWPFDQGAPALKDFAGSDSLDWSGRRLPRVLGDQTFWCVFHDLNTANHTSDPGSLQPMGAEVQLLAWADDWPGSLGRTIFFHYTITNHSDSVWRDALFGLWADADIGRGGNDLAGSDSALSMGFSYNNGPDLDYGESPPAVGIVLLAGPNVPSPGDSVWSLRQQRWLYNQRALPMTGCAAYYNGTDPQGETEVYYVLSGKDTDGVPQIDPTTNTPTRFMYSGDPVTQTGWLDETASDRRVVVGTGPLTMAPGESREIVFALVVGQGSSALGSVADLKQAAEAAHAVWRGCAKSPAVAVADIMPGACPNVLSFAEPIDLDFDFVRPAAALPAAQVVVALFGTPEFDPALIDPREVYLARVAPAGWTVEDVGRPDVRETPCGCGHNARDGRIDLLLSYDRDSIAEAMQPIVEGAVRTLDVHALSRDGWRGHGRDCLTFVDVGDDGPYFPPFAPRDDDKGSRFALSNQPNPFNAATLVSYRLASDGPVRLEIFDILGRRVATLVDAWQRAGEYQVMWNGVDFHGAPVGSGMYFYRLECDDGMLIEKMTLLK